LDDKPFPRQTRSIGIATSDDLIHWTLAADVPVFTAGVEGHWDAGGVSAPHLVVHGKRSLLYYYAYNENGGQSDLPKGIGLATTEKTMLQDLRRI
jgi:predicted GH43/DUF377 family glycosyl hydrolase